MLQACSHLVLATDDVPRMTAFFKEAFSITPYFENEMFSEFVLPSQFRIAFFKPVGAAAKNFAVTSDRRGSSIGITVSSVDDVYSTLQPNLAKWGASTMGPPKEHPWGEKSFLLVDFDGNRWEVAQSPSSTGMLINR